MKSKIAAAIVLTFASAIAFPVLANDAVANQVEKIIQLKDGGILYVFKDGKMAKEDKFGRAEYIYVGQSVEAVDGKSIAISSNEVARLRQLIRHGHHG